MRTDRRHRNEISNLERTSRPRANCAEGGGPTNGTDDDHSLHSAGRTLRSRRIEVDGTTGPDNQSDLPLHALANPIRLNDSRVATNCPSAWEAFFKSSDRSEARNAHSWSSSIPADANHRQRAERRQRSDPASPHEVRHFLLGERLAFDDSLGFGVAAGFAIATASFEHDDAMRDRTH